MLNFLTSCFVAITLGDKTFSAWNNIYIYIYNFNFKVKKSNVKQLRKSKPDLRQTQREGGEFIRHKGIHLEEVRSLHTSLLIFKVLDLTQVPSAYALVAYNHSSLDDLMQFTCVQWPQKLYCHRSHTVIGMCFWFCFKRVIIVFLWYYGSREKNVQKLTHTSSKCFALGTSKNYSFFLLLLLKPPP